MAVTTSAPYNWFAVDTDMTVFDGAADNSDVLNPGSIIRTTLYVAYVPLMIRRCDLRLRYSNGATISQNPIVQPFGMPGGSMFWQRLKDVSNVTQVALVDVPATDIDDGTYKYTAPASGWLTRGMKRIIVATKRKLTVSAGFTTGSQVEMRLLAE